MFESFWKFILKINNDDAPDLIVFFLNKRFSVSLDVIVVPDFPARGEVFYTKRLEIEVYHIEE